MSDLEHGIIEAERPQQCDLCGKIAELRPYGPNGECVCFACGMKDEPAAIRSIGRRIGAPTDVVEQVIADRSQP